MSRYQILLLSFLLLCSITKAQPVTRQYFFTHYNTNSGLASSETNTVLQDDDGYIWVGSNDGLQRYDGTRFKTYRRNKKIPGSLPSNLVWQLMLDKKKNLWVLTADGHIGIFNTKNFTFRESGIKTKHQDAVSSSIKRLLMDEYGNLFLLVTGREVLTYNEKKNEFSYENNFFNLPEGDKVSGFAQEPGTHRYWFGIEGKGFLVYDQTTRQLNTLNDDGNDIGIAKMQHINQPYHLYFDSKHRLWFQNWGGGFPYIYCYDRSQKDPLAQYEFITILKTYYETHEFFEERDGTIWLSGLGVMTFFNEKTRGFEFVYNGYINERSIVYERVMGFMEDREKNIWVATSNNGLYRFNPDLQYFNNVSHINRLTGNPGKGSIMSFSPVKGGGFFAGSWGDGLYYYNKNLQLEPANIRGIDNKYGPIVWSMASSRDSNTIWFAAQPGIFRIDWSTRTSTYYNPEIWLNKTVRQVAEDHNGDLWLGIHGYGVFKWSAAAGKNKFEDGIRRIEKIPVVQINKITVDSKGLIWVGTSSMGAYAIDPLTEKIVYHFGPEENGIFKLPEAGISSLLAYDEDRIIITTSNQVILFDRKQNKTSSLGSADLISGLISSVERDKAGYLWIATSTGLYRTGISKRVYLRFNRDDGIDNDHFTLAASKVLPDGRMLFGSSDQFILFDPSKIETSDKAPAVAITEFLVGNRALNVDSLQRLKRLELQSTNNSVVIEFSTLTFNSPCLVKYKLEGLDNEWRAADQSNQAIYSYLPTGKYTFLMKTVNEQGDSNGPVTRLVIHVNPPFWKTWWFYSLLVVLAGAIIFGLDRERMKRKEAILKMRTEIADNLHNQVNTALNNINILSEMARLKAEKDPAKSKEYIEQIHTKSHNMIIAMDDMLWSINPENDNMSKTTDRMREYIDALQNRYGVSIEIQVDKSVESLELNMKLRHEAFLIFKEGIKNLVTVGARNLKVYVSLEKGNLLFTTQFDTETCDLQQLNNLLHRQDLERRLIAINAKIDIDVHKTNSLITLEVPVV